MPSSKGTEKTVLSGRLTKMVPDGDEKRASWYTRTPDGKEIYTVVAGWSRSKYNEHTDKQMIFEGEYRNEAMFVALKAQENRLGG